MILAPTIPALPVDVVPLNDEAPFLDERLSRYVRFRLRLLDRDTLDGEDADDIRNTSWSKSLEKETFRDGCTGVRVMYLRTTVRRRISYLIRKEEQRRRGLMESWSKAMNGWCVVPAHDVWDHIAFLFGTTDDAVSERQTIGRAVPRPRLMPKRLARLPGGWRDYDLPAMTFVWRAMVAVWRAEVGCDGWRCDRCNHCRYWWHRRWWCEYCCRDGCPHPVCAGMRMFAALPGRTDLADALRTSADYVRAQVSLKVAQPEGGPCERYPERVHRCCCRCCCRCGCH